MRFERGEIAWSPNHDRGFLTVGIRQDRKDGSLVWFSFGDTYPYHYDKFNVAWYKNGDFVVQREKSQNRQWGQDLVRVHGPGRYTAKVEGCDTRWLRRDRCDQGWTVPVSVDVR